MCVFYYYHSVFGCLHVLTSTPVFSNSSQKDILTESYPLFHSQLCNLNNTTSGEARNSGSEPWDQQEFHTLQSYYKPILARKNIHNFFSWGPLHPTDRPTRCHGLTARPPLAPLPLLIASMGTTMDPLCLGPRPSMLFLHQCMSTFHLPRSGAIITRYWVDEKKPIERIIYSRISLAKFNLLKMRDLWGHCSYCEVFEGGHAATETLFSRETLCLCYTDCMVSQLSKQGLGVSLTEHGV
ncbi:hypothetical protein PM082_024014 [Marasmius tenuissimus]|nr:hypothetical protein PM082_024014 [Marasmius tenuissimus]